MKKGFTMYHAGKDYFFVTTCKRKDSNILIKKVCEFFSAPVNDNTRLYLSDKLHAAILEYKDNCIVITTKDGSIVTPYGDGSTIIVGFTKKERDLVTKENIEKLKKAYSDARALYEKAPDNYHVYISTDNNKSGDTASVSTLPFIFCPECAKDTCAHSCYAWAMALNGYHPDVIKSWAMNSVIALKDPEKFFREISAAMVLYRSFRFHVSGDIINAAYFQGMIDCMLNNLHCETMFFTKAYDIVNSWIDTHGASLNALPKNARPIFSRWKDQIKINNPYGIPESDVLEPDEQLPPDGKLCGNNCFFCFCTRTGCWTLEPGDVIYFYEH